jgi:hypothetical protein
MVVGMSSFSRVISLSCLFELLLQLSTFILKLTAGLSLLFTFITFSRPNGTGLYLADKLPSRLQALRFYLQKVVLTGLAGVLQLDFSLGIAIFVNTEFPPRPLTRDVVIQTDV